MVEVESGLLVSELPEPDFELKDAFIKGILKQLQQRVIPLLSET